MHSSASAANAVHFVGSISILKQNRHKRKQTTNTPRDGSCNISPPLPSLHLKKLLGHTHTHKHTDILAMAPAPAPAPAPAL